MRASQQVLVCLLQASVRFHLLVSYSFGFFYLDVLVLGALQSKSHIFWADVVSNLFAVDKRLDEWVGHERLSSMLQSTVSFDAGSPRLSSLPSLAS